MRHINRWDSDEQESVSDTMKRVFMELDGKHLEATRALMVEVYECMDPINTWERAMKLGEEPDCELRYKIKAKTSEGTRFIAWSEIETTKDVSSGDVTKGRHVACTSLARAKQLCDKLVELYSLAGLKPPELFVAAVINGHPMSIRPVESLWP